MRKLLTIGVVSFGLVLGACSDDSDTTGSPSSTSSSSSSSTASSSGSGGAGGMGGSAGGSGGVGGIGGSGGTNVGGMGAGGMGAGGMGAGGMGAGGQAAFTLTSPTVMAGGAIPTVHSCDGANTSPVLNWTAGPSGTLSYAMTLTDLSNGLVHSAIWDIPANVTSLPEDIQKAYMPNNVPGALQCKAYNGVPGYSGPCPGSTHTYEFAVFALDVAALNLAGAQTDITAAEVKAAATQHMLASSMLTADYTP